jgi:hypothetical protein
MELWSLAVSWSRAGLLLAVTTSSLTVPKWKSEMKDFD